MIDFHSHTFLSDGELIPSELVRCANAKGYRAIALTDHVDSSNIDFVIPRIIKVAQDLNKFQSTFVIPGIEITHAPPKQIPLLSKQARDLGATLILVHGESIAESVAPGTNEAALNSDIDILAHPGIIPENLAMLAAEKKIFLEITSRHGHSLSNGHLVKIANKTGARLIINSDAHRASDLLTKDQAHMILRASGLSEQQISRVFENSDNLLHKIRNQGVHQRTFGQKFEDI